MVLSKSLHMPMEPLILWNRKCWVAVHDALLPRVVQCHSRTVRSFHILLRYKSKEMSSTMDSDPRALCACVDASVSSISSTYDIIGGPVGLFSFRSYSEARSCSLLRVSLRIVALNEAWNFIVARARHIDIHGYVLAWHRALVFGKCTTHGDSKRLVLSSGVVHGTHRRWLSLGYAVHHH